MRKIFGLILFLLSSLQQAGAQTLSSPKTIYENIERIAVKKEIVASNQPRALVFTESSPSVRQMATEHLNSKETVALMLIDKGQIVYEGYAKSTSKVSRFVSMSMAKSLVALSVGEALCAKKINSLDDTAETYAPELKGLALGKAKIKDILKMSSGVKTPPNFHGDPYDKATDDLLFRKSNMLKIINKHNNTTTLMDDFWMVGYAGQRIGFNLYEDKIILNFSWIGNPEKTYALFRQWIKN